MSLLSALLLRVIFAFLLKCKSYIYFFFLTHYNCKNTPGYFHFFLAESPRTGCFLGMGKKMDGRAEK